MCIVFVALWVESYDTRCVMQGRLTATKALTMKSFQGGIAFYGKNDSGRGYRDTGLKWICLITPAEPYLEQFRSVNLTPSYHRFRVRSSPGLFGVTAPHWFLVVVTGMLAVLSKPKPRLKFSLRELLTVLTLVAVVLGAVEAASKLLVEETPF